MRYSALAVAAPFHLHLAALSDAFERGHGLLSPHAGACFDQLNEVLEEPLT